LRVRQLENRKNVSCGCRFTFLIGYVGALTGGQRQSGPRGDERHGIYHDASPPAAAPGYDVRPCFLTRFSASTLASHPSGRFGINQMGQAERYLQYMCGCCFSPGKQPIMRATYCPGKRALLSIRVGIKFTYRNLFTRSPCSEFS
jgi:hypothetical protein